MTTFDQRSDVPMTRPEEAIAVVEGIGRRGTFIELDDGRILYSASGGRFQTSSDGGETWSESWQAVDTDGSSLGRGESGLVPLADGAIGYAARYRATEQGDHDASIAFFRSEDGGRTWSRPIRVSPPGVDHAQIHDAVMRTSSGRIVVPAYAYIRMARDPRGEGDKKTGAYLRNQWVGVGAHDYDPAFAWSCVYYSDDEGHTWQGNRDGKIFIWDEVGMTWNRTTEPTIEEVAPGHLLMFMRTELGRLYQSWSTDNGETWTAPTPTLLAASSSPAQLLRIPATGDLVVVWSQASEQDIERGVGRSRLSTAVSRSQGAVWEFFQNIDSALEGTRIEPGPLRRARPAGVVLDRDRPQGVRPAASIIDLPEDYRLTSYPSVFFSGDRMLIGHTNAHFEADGTHVKPGRLIVVPVSWLYGGAEHMQGDGFREDLSRRFPPVA